MVGRNLKSFCSFGTYIIFVKISLSASGLVWALPGSHDLVDANKISQILQACVPSFHDPTLGPQGRGYSDGWVLVVTHTLVVTLSHWSLYSFPVTAVINVHKLSG